MRPGGQGLARPCTATSARRSLAVLTVLTVLTALLGAAGASGCGSSSAPVTPGPIQAPGYQPPEVMARAVDFSGSCKWGRSPGPPRLYRVPLQVRDNPSGTVLVRRTAEFDVTDRSNLLGELRAGTEVLGDGPVYDGRTGQRGYAIVVRGHTGRVCRGYVSATSVRAR